MVPGKEISQGPPSNKALVLQVIRPSSGLVCCVSQKGSGLGLDVNLSSSQSILVMGVRAGPVKQSNDKQKPGAVSRLEVGDRIVRVNDVDGALEMMRVLNDPSVRHLKILFSKPLQVTTYPELREDFKRTLPEYDLVWRDDANATLHREVNLSGFRTKVEKKEFWVQIATTGACEAVPVGVDRSEEAARVVQSVKKIGQREVARRGQHLQKTTAEPEKVNTTWWYNPVNGIDMRAREKPHLESARAERTFTPGDVFVVSRELEGADKVLFLELADGSGWLFDHKPGVGVMCERHDGPATEKKAAGHDASGPPSDASSSTASFPPDHFCACRA